MNVLERDYYTIEAIELMPEASQRDLAKYTGMSLGKVNYCLKELVQKRLDQSSRSTAKQWQMVSIISSNTKRPCGKRRLGGAVLNLQKGWA